MSDAAANGTLDSIDVAALLLASPSSRDRASEIASATAALIADSACVLYRFNAEAPESPWTAIAYAGDLTLTPGLTPSDDLLAPLLTETPEPVVYIGADLQREEFAHLQISRSFVSIAYLPLLQDAQLIGAMELLTFSTELTAEDLESIAPLERLTVPAILGAEATEIEREELLDSVRRLTQLYDLEKSLNATLDLDQVVAQIPRKVLPMLDCQAVHLWLFDGGVLTLMSTNGADPTVEVGMTQLPGQGYVAEMAEEGQTLLIADPGDERLQRRSEGSEAPIWTAILVPLMEDDSEIGVLEAVNKNTGEPFDEDDEFFLGSIAETVGSALKNAGLMFAERKLAILEALVHVSSEITSTLRLERLLKIIVNSPQNVLPFERCSIALDSRGKLQIKAISGMASIPLGDAQVDPLIELLRWLSTESDSMYVRQHEETPGEDIAPPVAKHFEATGYRGLFTLPLNDDQGRVGVLIYESSDPDFLDLPHTEMIKILAGQATVAIRNALLYREVPLISILEPLMQRKQALLRTSSGRKLGLLIGSIVVALFLIFCPLPLRLTGDATIAAQHLVTVAAPVDGNVATVVVQEGQHVEAGQLLASMNDFTWRSDLDSAEAKYQAALLTMQSDLAHGSEQAGADRAQLEYLRAEADRARTRVSSAQLRSPIDGIVMTPQLQDAAGEHLEAGAAFAQVLDLSSAVVDISIPQSDASLLAPGQSVAVKLDSYPQRSWHGSVAVVSPQAIPGDGDRTFAARVPLVNADATLRSGMSGRAKIFIGYRPAGYVLLRRPALWAWQTLWNWFGW
jgi:multidrug resistance efflux pump/GAF domain-containing protein